MAMRFLMGRCLSSGEHEALSGRRGGGVRGRALYILSTRTARSSDARPAPRGVPPPRPRDSGAPPRVPEGTAREAAARTGRLGVSCLPPCHGWSDRIGRSHRASRPAPEAPCTRFARPSRRSPWSWRRPCSPRPPRPARPSTPSRRAARSSAASTPRPPASRRSTPRASGSASTSTPAAPWPPRCSATPSKVKFVPLNSQQRFAALQAGEIDVLSRNTTWTLTRDASLGIAFTGINYYDGQGFMVAEEAQGRLGQEARQRHRLRAGRHHQREERGRLLRRRRHQVQDGGLRHRRGDPGRLLRRPLPGAHHRRLRPLRRPLQGRRSRTTTSSSRRSSPRSRSGRRSAAATTSGSRSSAGSATSCWRPRRPS